MKVYTLDLWGDIESTPGMVILEVAGVSLDRSVLERLKVEKDKELREYLNDGSSDNVEDEDQDDEDDDDEEDKDAYFYHNFDLSSRPTWEITEHTLL